MVFVKGNKPGNPGGRPSVKPWTDAIRLEVNALLTDPKKPKGEKVKALRLIARRLAKEAMKGNMQAVNIIGDRLEGKAIQAVDVAIEQKQGNPEVMTWLEDAVEAIQKGKTPVALETTQDKDKMH